MNKKVALVIMDGWGNGPQSEHNAIFKAHTPFVSSLKDIYPTAELLTCGEHVGLPEGQMGNSEVGHLNLGAGRIVYQSLGKIQKAIKDGDFQSNSIIQNAFKETLDTGSSLHLIGLVSDGGVHSHIDHLIELVNMADKAGLKKVYIHAFTDGRDTDPKSGRVFIEKLDKAIQGKSAKIATVIGRYYAMDRDKRWERVKRAYDLLIHGEGVSKNTAISAIEDSYANGVTDEFIEPVLLDKEGLIKANDTVLCFNFRTDRCREITQVLTQQDFSEYNMQVMPLNYYTMTNYDEKFKNIKVIYDSEDLSLTLGEVIEGAGKNQIRIAETEKYPHVTFFFSGGREAEFKNERRLLIPSPKVATYDLQPEMSAYGITDAILDEINKGWPDFICLNFANTDMVGHTGVFEAIKKSAEVVDSCVERIVNATLANGYTVLLTADHGNADYAVNEDGSPNTAHTLNPVPIYLIDKDFKPEIHSGILADIAPTVLKLMGIPAPEVMNGKPLFN